MNLAEGEDGDALGDASGSGGCAYGKASPGMWMCTWLRTYSSYLFRSRSRRSLRSLSLCNRIEPVDLGFAVSLEEVVGLEEVSIAHEAAVRT